MTRTIRIMHFKLLDDESLTSTTLGNDHEFIIKEYYLHWCEVFWGSPKQRHESLCSKQNNIIPLWRVVFD